MDFSSLYDLCNNIVNTVTLGQVQAIADMYNQWVSTHSIPSPGTWVDIIAVFIVLVRYAVPILIAYFFVKNILRNIYLVSITMIVFIVVYTLFVFNPIELFNVTVEKVNNFYYFVLDLHNQEYSPILFTFLKNGLYIFTLRALVIFITTWIMFMGIVLLFTFIFWIFTGGKSIWNYTEKNFKAYTLQLTIIFLIFLPIVGAFKAFSTVLAFVIGGIEFREAFYTIRGYEKICFNDGGNVVCKWGK